MIGYFLACRSVQTRRHLAPLRRLASATDDAAEAEPISCKGGGNRQGESPVGERAQVNAIARALGVDWNTAEKWLTRFERLRRPPASE